MRPIHFPKYPKGRYTIEQLEARRLLTVLTFETGQSQGNYVDQDYGDAVQMSVESTFFYGSRSGATPEVAVTYGEGVTVWHQGFGKLKYAAFLRDGASTEELAIILEASAGHTVSLVGFDLASYGTTSRTVDGVRVTGSSGTTLFSATDQVVTGAESAMGMTPYTFAGIVDTRLTIILDSSNLGIASDTIGISNIEFAQSPGGGIAMPDLLPDRIAGFYDSGAGPIAGPYTHDGSLAGPINLNFLNGAKSGITNVDFVSLPTNSHVVVEFVDEHIIDGSGADLFLAEEGPAGDYAQVEVSSDGEHFVNVGMANTGVETAIDIANKGVTDPVRFVRVRGLDNNG